MRSRLFLLSVLSLAACGPSRPEANQVEPAPARVEVAPVPPPEPAPDSNAEPASSNMIAEDPPSDWPRAIDTGACPFEPPSDPPPPCSTLPPVPQPGTASAPPQYAPVAVEAAIEHARAEQPMFGVVGARPALLTSIRGTKQRLAASKNPTDQGSTAAQLGELYGELAELERKAAAGPTSSPAERKARQDAIHYYDEVSRNAPNHPMLDQVTYQRSWQYERLGDLNQARRSYFDLIQKFPTSRLMPSAYFAFAELFYKESFADPSKWAISEQAYKEVLKYPPPMNRLTGFAQYRLGFVQWHQQQKPAALVSMRRTIEYGKNFPGSPGAEELREAAVTAAASIYAETGRVDRACTFFHATLGSPEATLAALDRLGDAYWARGDKRSAAVIHGLLRRYDRGPRACFHEAVLRVAAP